MKYLVIDVTTLPETRIVAITKLRQAEAMGKIQKAKGRRCIAPPLAGAGFSKLEKEQLQYLYWNTTQQTPPEDYGVLIQEMQKLAEAMPLDDTTLESLEHEVQMLYPDEAAPRQASTPSAPREPRVAGEAPKATSTTGRVWVIADKVAADNPNNTDWKFLRAIIVNLCKQDGINEATAATQYSKWKAAKLAAKAA